MCDRVAGSGERQTQDSRSGNQNLRHLRNLRLILSGPEPPNHDLPNLRNLWMT
jgi:hypothetical protein